MEKLQEIIWFPFLYSPYTFIGCKLWNLKDTEIICFQNAIVLLRITTEKITIYNKE